MGMLRKSFCESMVCKVPCTVKQGLRGLTALAAPAQHAADPVEASIGSRPGSVAL